jgi:hypothetical protein
VRLEGLGKLKKNPPHPGFEPATFQLVGKLKNSTSSGLEPGTFQLVA